MAKDIWKIVARFKTRDEAGKLTWQIRRECRREAGFRKDATGYIVYVHSACFERIKEWYKKQKGGKT